MTRLNSNNDRAGTVLTRTPRPQPSAAIHAALGRSRRGPGRCARFWPWLVACWFTHRSLGRSFRLRGLSHPGASSSPRVARSRGTALALLGPSRQMGT